MPRTPVPNGKPVCAPLIDRLRRVTTAPAEALIVMPLLELFRTDAKAEPWVPSMVIDFVIVTCPYPLGSSALLSPSSAVFDTAAAKVLQGAVREQGFTSSPTPDTHVLVAWA